MRLLDTMEMVGYVPCGFVKRPANMHWVSADSLQLLEARRSTSLTELFLSSISVLKK